MKWLSCTFYPLWNELVQFEWDYKQSSKWGCSILTSKLYSLFVSSSNWSSQKQLLFWPCSVIPTKKNRETKERKLYDAPVIYNPFPTCRAKLVGASLFGAPAKMLLQAHRSYLANLDKLHTTAAEKCLMVVSGGRLPAEGNGQHELHQPSFWETADSGLSCNTWTLTLWRGLTLTGFSCCFSPW